MEENVSIIPSSFICKFIQYLLDIFITSDKEQNLSLRSSFSAGNTESNPHHRAVDSPLTLPRSLGALTVQQGWGGSGESLKVRLFYLEVEAAHVKNGNICENEPHSPLLLSGAGPHGTPGCSLKSQHPLSHRAFPFSLIPLKHASLPATDSSFLHWLQAFT